MKSELFGVKAPAKDCTDRKCPFHGEINVKGEFLKGKIVKKDINRSATVEWFRSQYIPKYERYQIRRSRLRTHNPACINAAIGQEVLLAKTRPLSKNKNHVILQITSTEIALPVESGKKEATKKKVKARKLAEVEEQ